MPTGQWLELMRFKALIESTLCAAYVRRSDEAAIRKELAHFGPEAVDAFLEYLKIVGA